MMHDVVVVGGGPAGCYTASLLSQTGLDVQVLEEHPAIGEPVDCSGVIGAESFETLGLPSALKLGVINTISLVSPSQLKVNFSPSSPLAYIVDRAAFDRAIADRTAASGAIFHLGSRLVELRVLEGCVELVVQDNGNRESPITTDQPIRHSPFAIGSGTVRARVVILACGPHYKFQRQLGMGQPGNFLKTAQVEAAVQGVEEAKVLLGSQVAPGSFGWIVPFQRGGRESARIGVSSKTSAVPYLKKLLEHLYLEDHLRSPNVPIRSWVIPIAPLRRTYADRVLAVGDAAGQTKPTTGGGIYYGLLCAEAAAETVARAFAQGDFSAETLRGYEKAWRKKLGTELRLGAFFRRLVESLTDEEIDALFLIVQSDGVLSGIAQKARFDQHRDVILFALRHPALGKIFLRGLFR